THYPPTHGLPELRVAIARYHERDGVDWKSSEVTVTSGSGVSLFVSMAGTVNPGEAVVLLEPYFMAYSSIVEYLGAREIGVPPGESYRLDLDILKESITPRTKMIVLCNPGNPSGTVYTEEELKGIADIAVDNDLLVLTDEVYKEFVWDDRKHICIASLPGMKERTILSSSFSKTFAMTGWRLGYTIADKPLASMIQKIPVGYRTNTFVQIAGIAALEGPWGPVEEMAEEYYRRRQFMAPRLSRIEGIHCHTPEGAFYLFPDLDGLGIGSEEFCESLLKEKKILTRPGTAFGTSCESNMRIPLIKPVGTLEEIANAIEDHTQEICR
ncbi:MAG: aminotransferase class I/II-fold pyridoxal phosphate-dependent enzyme, partial [Candidatus Bathyarchaeota archaeon]